MEQKNDARERASNTRRKRPVVIVAVILAILFQVWTVAGSFMVIYGAEAPAEGEALQGVWVTTDFAIDYPSTYTTDPAVLRSDIDTIVSQCTELGMHAIFFQVRPAADAFYCSEIFSWSRFLSGTAGGAPEDDFDPLAYFVERAHEANIQLHAWINPYRITQSGQAEWDALPEEHPAKGTYADSVREYKGNYYFDPASEEARKLLIDGALEIVEKYPVDGIHLDDYFYPGTDFDDAEAFEASETTLPLEDWRRDNVNALIRELHEAIHEVNPACRFGVSPSGIWANRDWDPRGSDTRGYQHYITAYADSLTWIQEGWVDYIAPQIYWEIGHAAADYDTLAHWWNQAVEGTDVDLYIGMADYRSADAAEGSAFYGTAMLEQELALNRTLDNVKGELHFHMQSLADDQTLYDFYMRRNRPDLYYQLHDYFNDITGHWAEEAIRRLYTMGAVNGIGDDLFGPDRQITRAEFVKMLANVAGESVNASVPDAAESVFSDVPADAWYAPFVYWAAAAGVVEGYGDEENHFGPDDRITREQMAAVLCRYLAQAEGETRIRSDAIAFADWDAVSSWATDYVYDAVRRGLFQGAPGEDAEGNPIVFFYPLNNATRAEVATVLDHLRDSLIAQEQEVK